VFHVSIYGMPKTSVVGFIIQYIYIIHTASHVCMRLKPSGTTKQQSAHDHMNPYRA